MEQELSFFSFRDPNVLWVSAGIMLVCGASALVGVFALLRRQALAGDAVAHSILPGLCTAFLISGSRHPLVLLLGAFASGWLSLGVINYLQTRTRLRGEAALALVLSVFYGLGILLLTAIQQGGNAAQSGLDKFLFGKAAAMLPEDVQVFGLFALLLVGVVLLLLPLLAAVSFDRAYALSRGLPVRRIEGLLSVLTVAAIALGIQAVGVVLMAALLIAPAAAARYWTHSLRAMLIIAALLAVLSGLAGAFISYTLPNMPTGPWVVSVLSLAALLSILLGSRKGLLARLFHQRRNRLKMARENLLKCLYQLGEQTGDFGAFRRRSEILSRRLLPESGYARSVRQLRRRGLVSQTGSAIALTAAGVAEGQRIVRLHRLWELYLTTHLALPADHVHEDAEAMEHVITPEIERELELKLDFPRQDPHHTPIPRSESRLS